MTNQQIENNALTNEINDLEPNQTDEIKGGQTREHILLARTGLSSGNTSSRGDWDGDGDVDAGDFQIYR